MRLVQRSSARRHSWQPIELARRSPVNARQIVGSQAERSQAGVERSHDLGVAAGERANRPVAAEHAAACAEHLQRMLHVGGEIRVAPRRVVRLGDQTR